VSQACASTDPLLEDVLAHPDDDGARLRYAADLTSRGDPRGEFIALQVKGALATKEERRRAAELLKTHRDVWAAPFGVVKPGQVWERGFLVECKVGSNRSPEQWQRARAEPQWRLVRRLRHNMQLPDPDLADCLEELLCFNASAWLAERRRPWSRLRELVARENEVARLASAHERAARGLPPQFPALEKLHLYDWGRFELTAIAALPSLRSIEIIGASSYLVPPRDLPNVLAGLESSPLAELVWAPDQTSWYRAALRREPGGPFTELEIHLRVRKGTRPTISHAYAVRALLDGLVPRPFHPSFYVAGARVDPGSFGL
jgi:uncharacterized protein (TIGR02996 family)